MKKNDAPNFLWSKKSQLLRTYVWSCVRIVTVYSSPFFFNFPHILRFEQQKQQQKNRVSCDRVCVSFLSLCVFDLFCFGQNII